MVEHFGLQDHHPPTRQAKTMRMNSDKHYPSDKEYPTPFQSLGVSVSGGTQHGSTTSGYYSGNHYEAGGGLGLGGRGSYDGWMELSGTLDSHGVGLDSPGFPGASLGLGALRGTSHNYNFFATPVLLDGAECY